MFATMLGMIEVTNSQTEIRESAFTKHPGKDVFLMVELNSRGVEEPFEAYVKYTQQLFVETTSFGTVRMQVSRLDYTEVQPNGQPKLILLKDATCRIRFSKICWIWNVSPMAPDHLEVYHVKIIAVESTGRDHAPLRFNLSRSEVVALNPAVRAYLDLQNVNQVDFRVSLALLNTSIPRQNGKIQFFALQNWVTDTSRGMLLRMYVRHGTEKATPENVIERSANTIGTGTAMTLVPSDSDFCWNPDCFYTVHLDVRELGQVDFVTELINRQTYYAFGESFDLIDQLRENDNLTYELTHIGDYLPKVGVDYVWRFHIYPTEGDADFSVNPDALPDTYEDYRFHTNSDGVSNPLKDSYVACCSIILFELLVN